MDVRNLRKGDHVCGLYSTRYELAEIVAEYLIDGLQRKQRCWFITTGDETADFARPRRCHGASMMTTSRIN